MSGAAMCSISVNSCLISCRRSPGPAVARASTRETVASVTSVASLRQRRLPGLPLATSSPGTGRNLKATSLPGLFVDRKLKRAPRRERQVTATAVRSNASVGHKDPQDVDKDPQPLSETSVSPPAESPFEWKSNWYAVAPAQDLDPNRPHPITVLGRRMVLWKDQNFEPEVESAGSDSPSSQPASQPAPNGVPVGTPTKGVFGQESQWKCFLDQCPHRLVPLSEGRIDDKGRLQCSYHGWTFNGDGGCAGIPQANREGPEGRAVGSPRACALSFPVREVKGLLFVWPDESLPARALAALTPLPIPDDMPDSTEGLIATARVLPYGYETLAENVVDPSHLPWAHHGVGAINRSQGSTPYKWISVASASEGVGGFEGESMSGYLSQVQFKAPGMFAYLGRFGAKPAQGDSEKGGLEKSGDSDDDDSAENGASLEGALASSGASADAALEKNGASAENGASAKNGASAENGAPSAGQESVPSPPQAPVRASPPKGGRTFAAVLFITPVEPGKSRIVVWEGLTGPVTTPAWKRFPRWLMHMLKLYFLDGDAFFLHAQERMHGGYVMKKQSSSQAADYFMPTAADRYVVAFRQWLERYGGGGVLYPPEVDVPLPTDWERKEVVLDRYSSHVKDCTTCQKALSRVKLLQKVAGVLAVLAAVALLLPFVKAQTKVTSFLVGAALGGGYSLLGWLKQQFYFANYDHATR